MSDTYYTLEAPSEGKVTEKRSRFLAFAVPVATVAEAKEVIAKYGREYHDARHVCWAYMVGPLRDQYLSSDNGEPSGTAGKPILGQINSFRITNVVIVVVRYFGGIKLGTPGLIAAYREAAREAIESGMIVERHRRFNVTFTFPYMALNDVMKVAKQAWVDTVAQKFDNSCEMTLECRLDDEGRLRDQLEEIDGLTFMEKDQ